MKSLRKLLAACIPVVLFAACGGDTQDRLDLSDPVVRLVHASPGAPSVTLYRESEAQPEASNAAFPFASEYFVVDSSFADWTVQTDVGGIIVGMVSIDAARGTKYSIVVLPASKVDSTLYVIADPFNKPLGSKSTRLRVFHASFGSPSLDLYMNSVGADIQAPGVEPLIAATEYKKAGPASGEDSVDIPAGTYQLTVTVAGTKSALFVGQLAFGDNRDLLLAVVPDLLAPGAIRVFAKLDEEAGMSEVPPCLVCPQPAA